jgi:flagellin
MVDRLNNSTGVLGALKYLQSARTGMDGAETRLASGLKVAQARDDASAYQSAATMRNEQGSLKSVTLSLGRAESVSDVAISAGEQVSKLLIEMRKTAADAMGGDLSDQQRAVFAKQFQDQLHQLTNFVNSASFDDSNTINGSKPLGVSFVADAEANTSLTLKGRNFMPGGPVVEVGMHYDLNTIAGAQAAYDAVGRSIDNVGNELQDMVSEGKRVRAQIGFVSKLVDALAAGVGRMVDTDLASETALIQALQVKQELSAKSVGITSGAPQALLSLFRSS